MDSWIDSLPVFGETALRSEEGAKRHYAFRLMHRETLFSREAVDESTQQWSIAGYQSPFVGGDLNSSGCPAGASERQSQPDPLPDPRDGNDLDDLRWSPSSVRDLTISGARRSSHYGLASSSLGEMPKWAKMTLCETPQHS
jgi:hypothetical protein